jgi:HPt (histidine-containing phosphotransfer) domain-containing protein
MSGNGELAADPAGSPVVLNSAVMRGLAASVGVNGSQLVVEIIDTYLQDSVRLVERMQEGASHADLDMVRRAAHTLKGSSGTIGAAELSLRCAEVERSCSSLSSPGPGDPSWGAPGLVEAPGLEGAVARLRAEHLLVHQALHVLRRELLASSAS